MGSRIQVKTQIFNCKYSPQQLNRNTRAVEVVFIALTLGPLNPGPFEP